MSVIHGAHSADTINEWLRKRYGTNPYGGNLFRVVMAQEVFIVEGGTAHIWPEGSKVEDRGSLQEIEGKHDLIIKPTANVAVKTEGGLKEVPKYPEMEGWILERWFPAEMYGTEATWLSFKDEGGYPMLGPFPHRGEYEMASTAPIPFCPTQSQLEKCIAAIFKARQQAAEGTVASRMRDRVNRALEREKKEQQAYMDHAMAKLNDIKKPLFGSSLAAGRIRTKIAERIGITEHCGN